jgi:hypothetical protein
MMSPNKEVDRPVYHPFWGNIPNHERHEAEVRLRLDIGIAASEIPVRDEGSKNSQPQVILMY